MEQGDFLQKLLFRYRTPSCHASFCGIVVLVVRAFFRVAMPKPVTKVADFWVRSHTPDFVSVLMWLIFLCLKSNGVTVTSFGRRDFSCAKLA